MRKFYLLPLALLIIVGATITADARYHGHKGQWNWWENQDMRAEVGLTKDQEAKIDELVNGFKPRVEEANRTFVNNKKLYHKTMNNPEASNADIIKAFDVMWDSKLKKSRVGLDMKLAIRDVLTPEQRVKASELKKNMRDKQKSYMKEQMKKMKEVKEPETTE